MALATLVFAFCAAGALIAALGAMVAFEGAAHSGARGGDPL